MNNIADLQDVIRRLHGADSEHAGSVPVIETFRGQTVWDGTVDVFTLRGHAKAQRCYAWCYQDDQGATQYVAVLELPPVTDARSAVKAYIVGESRRGALR